MQSVAVLVVGYRRPDLLSNLLNLLLKARIANVVVSIDADDLGSIDEKIKELSKSKFPEFDWRFRKKNLGVGLHVPTAVGEVLKEFEACFVLEDDIIFSTEALKSAIKLLQRGLPLGCITIGLFGALPSSPLLKVFLGENRWRATEYFSAWAWGIDRSSWRKYELVLNETSIQSALANSNAWQRKKAASKGRWLRRFYKVSLSPNFAWDFQMQFATYKHDGYHLLPIYRSADNVGFGDARSTNTKLDKPRWYIGAGSEREILHTDTLSVRTSKLLMCIDGISWAGDNSMIIAKSRFLSSLKKS